MSNELDTNKHVWENMFDWIHSRGGHRRYPNETVVTWLLGYAKTDHPNKRVLDVGCGWSQCLPLFMNEGFEYVGIDVTDKGFLDPGLIQRQGWADRTRLELFVPPLLEGFADASFSHAISTEALHLNSTPEAMQAIVNEVHRVLMPGGRFLATVMRPDYWYMPNGGATWVGEETIEVNENHVEKNRIGARYFVFKDQARIRHYFERFSKIYIGRECRVFGEYPEKFLSHWIISVEK